MISIFLVLLSLSTVAASDDSQSIIAVDDNSGVQVPDIISSTSDDILGASEIYVNDVSASADAEDNLKADEKENVTMDISTDKDVITVGENVTVTVTLPTDATGRVSVGTKFFNLTDGVAVGDITSRLKGNLTVPVVYYGDEKYNTALDYFNLTVLPSEPKQNVTMDITVVPDEITVGENATVTVVLPEDATGILSVGTVFANVTNGIATANVSSKIKGNITVPVIYYGDKKYNIAMDSFNLTVLASEPKQNVTMDITVVPDEITVGENATVVVILPEDATGKVSVGTKIFNLTNGIAIGNISSIIKGNITVPVIYFGDEKYNYAIDSFNLTVLPSPPKDNVTMDISIAPDEITVGENATVTVTLPEDATGIVSIGINFVNVENGVAVANVTSIIKGNITVPVIYFGDKKYNYATGSVNLTVLPSPPKENVTMDVSIAPDEISVGENATVTVTLSEDATGIVSIGINFVNVENGVAVANVTGLVPGNFTVPVIYYGDKKYNYAVDAVNVTVIDSRAVPTMEIVVSPEEITIGENATVTVTLPDDATGIVSIGLDFVKVENGTALATVYGLIKGNYTIPVIYYGDENYTALRDSVNITVNDLPPKENVTIDITVAPEEIYVGENATVTVTLPEDATGIVSIGIHFVNVTEGVAVANVSGLVPGNLPVPVIYYGDEKYKYAIDTVNVTVLDPRAVPTMKITVTPEEITVGENVTVTVELPEDATGIVSIGLDFVKVENGTAVATGLGIIPGNYTIPVIYYGDENYTIVKDSVNITVNDLPPKENVTMEITVAPEEIYVGENATVTVTLPEDATGIVSIGIHFVNVTDGVAVANVSGLIAGNLPVPVIYYGDEKYKYAIDVVNVTVLDNKENVTMEITVVPEEIYVGENATITVTLPENATGIVSIGIWFVNVTDGVAVANFSSSIKGNYTIPVIYFGDENYKYAYDTVNITVLSNKKDPQMNVTVDKDVILVRENTTVTVTLPEDATGKVSIGTKIVNVTNGIAVANITSIITGKIPVPVIYYGDENYTMAAQYFNLTVKKEQSIIVTAPDVTKYYKGPERFVVNVTDYQGNPLANKTVEIFINNVTYTRTTDENGTASMALGLNSGVYNVTTTVDDESVDSVVTILATVNGTDVVKVYRNGTQYYATFLDTQGNYLADGTEVTFNINGVMYKRNINGTEGKARLNLNLEQGTYIITAINPVTDEMAANNITILPRITNNENLVKYYKNDSQYYVTLIGDDGNPVGANETVIFNINGVFYERQTNASGVARLNINLEPGEYIITAEYKECRVSNNITVLPVLSAEDLTKKFGTPDPFVANLVDGQGKPYANQKVEFNINGVFYYRTTNSTGQAALNINLQPGEYIITSSYNGANIANTVKVEV